MGDLDEARYQHVGRWASLRALPRVTGTGIALGVFYVLVVLLSIAQDAGRTTYDTRAELTERPTDFLGGVFNLWHGETNFGELQNQAYGYLFPQGPWFVIGELLHAPEWLTQRFWSALLLIVACEGARRVAGASGVARWGAVLAGIAYALSPRILGTDGVITGETLASAMLPWVLLPVLLHLRGRLLGWQAALMSSAAIVAMGGVNAVEVLAALPLVLIVLVWGVARGLAKVRFLAQWCAGATLAMVWWGLPLIVLSRYAPPFYEYVESAANTTSLIGWSEALRGDDHWVAYLTVGQQAWWPAAYYLATNAVMIVVAAAVSAIGLWGLVRLGNGLRTPYVLSVALGLTLLTVAHGGWAGAPVAEMARTSLDGALQIFRNVHKIDPIVRLPIAIGFGQASLLAIAALQARWAWARSAGMWLACVPALLVLALLSPYFLNQVRTPGWTEFPDSWQQTRSYLAAQDDDRATLLTPGTGFSMQDWGWTLDEPLYILGGTSTVVRSQAPIIPGQSIRYLSALDDLVSTGSAQADLSTELARAGIGHVVVRRDLERSVTHSRPPAGASLSMVTAGLRREATFGTLADGSPAIEVYAVDKELPRMTVTDRRDVATVAGAPESVLGLAALIGAAATVSAGEDGWDEPADIVTDDNQRRERNFGEITEGLSAVLAKDEPWRLPRAAHDYPVAPHAEEVVAQYEGLSSLRASSSRGYADTFGEVLPEFAPYSALDGDPSTRWLSSPSTDPREQWIRMEFEEPRPVSKVRILPVQDPSAATVRTFEVIAGDQRETLANSASGNAVTLDLDGSEVSSVEIHVGSVSGSAKQAQVGIREISLDGFKPRRTYVVPAPIEPEASWQFHSIPEQRACIPNFGLPLCNTGRIRVAEEATGMDRTFDTPQGQTADVTGLVLARSSPEAVSLLDPLDTSQTVVASSVYGDDPKAAGRFAYDGLPGTAWISSAEDATPSLRLKWKKSHRVRGIALDDGLPYDRFTSVVLYYGDTFQRVRLRGGRMTPVEPFRTRDLRVSVTPSAPGLPVMVAGLQLDGVDIEREFDPETPTGAVCGLGPRVEVGGRSYDTRVTGTMGDVLDGVPMDLAVCKPVRKASAGTPTQRVGKRVQVHFGPGQHELRTPPSAAFQVVELTGVSIIPRPTPTQPRSLTIDSWGSDTRTATLGPGAASLVAVPENYNVGWQAELDGTSLTPIRVDGWRQGFQVPAGEGGDLRITLGPQRLFETVLILGLVLSGLVLVAGLALALVLAWRGALRPGPGVELPPARGGWRTTAVVAVLAVPLAGPVLVLGLGLGGLLTRRDRLRAGALAAVLLVLGSGVIDAVATAPWHQHAADVLAALGLGAFLGFCLVPVPPPADETEAESQEALA